MEQILNAEYFEFLSSNKDNMFEYKAYKCRYHSIILYSSEDCQPLAALSFRSPQTDNAILVPRSDIEFSRTYC